MITEEVGVQLTDKYDVYGESCEYLNARTLFHNGFYELETKQRMLKEADWKYRERKRYSWDCYGCFDEDRGIRIGLCFCITTLLTVSTIVIGASQSAFSVLLSIVFYLVAFCLLICFVIRTTECLERATADDQKECLLSIDDFATTMTRSGGLYFDDTTRSVHDLTVLVNYSENTTDEIIYVQRREKLFDFDSILEIGYNEASNEPDWSEYKLYESLPSYSYNVNENDFCAMIIKYRESAKQQRDRKRKSISVSMSYPDGLTPLHAANANMTDQEGVARWQDRKCNKGEFMQKMEALQRILELVGLSDTVVVRKEPYRKFHKNPVTKL